MSFCAKRWQRWVAILAQTPNLRTAFWALNVMLRWKQGQILQPRAAAVSSGDAKDVAMLSHHFITCHGCHSAPRGGSVGWPFGLIPNLRQAFWYQNAILRWKEGQPLQPKAAAVSSDDAKDMAMLSHHSITCHGCRSAPRGGSVGRPFWLKCQI